MADVLPDGRRLGAHLPLGAGMVKAVDRAKEIGANAIQIFGDNPTAWRRRADPPKEQAAFRERLRERREHPQRLPDHLVADHPGQAVGAGEVDVVRLELVVQDVDLDRRLHLDLARHALDS